MRGTDGMPAGGPTRLGVERVDPTVRNAGDLPPPALETCYLDPAIAPIHRGDARIEPLVDGLDYFAAIADALRKTRGPGDVIYLLAFQIDPAWRIPGDPSGASLAELLAAKAALGVDVRVVLNGTPLPTNPWRENGAAARVFTAWPSLAGRVRVDRAGMVVFRTEHQKTWIIRAGGELVAFIGGMDPVPDHWDRAPHTTKRWPDGSSWGWHDVGARVTGAAIRGMWDNVRDRWRRAGGDDTLVPPIGPCPTAAPVASPHSIQVVRARYTFGQPRIDELLRAMKRAIAAAERYIYVEDQFLCDYLLEVAGVAIPPMPYGVRGFSLFDEVAARIRANPALKVVLVGSGKSDPIDFGAGRRNQRFTPSLRRMHDLLTPAQRTQVAVWRVDDLTVHSKLVLIDDRFAMLGSANFRARSMRGVDTELQLALVAGDDTVRRLRATLWAEHLGLEPIERPLIDDLDRALGHWHPAWPTGAPLPATRRRLITRVME